MVILCLHIHFCYFWGDRAKLDAELLRSPYSFFYLVVRRCRVAVTEVFENVGSLHVYSSTDDVPMSTTEIGVSSNILIGEYFRSLCVCFQRRSVRLNTIII